MDSRTPKQLAFLAGLKTLAAMPARDGAVADIAQLERDWWRNVQDAGWITPQVWAGAVVELQGEGSWRPAWPEVYDACLFVKALLEEEGVQNYSQAQQQRADRARTGTENRPGRDEPQLPAPAEPPSKKEVRRALILRHAAIARATMKRRRRLTAEYAQANGLSLGHCAIPEEAWKGLDEPTPEEIAAELEATPPEKTVGALYRALRPGQREPIRVEWVKADGTALADENGEDLPPYYVSVGPPDPPSPATVKEREKVMAQEPVVTPYNEREFRRDHPGVKSVADAADYLWPKVD